MKYIYNRFEGYTLKDCDCQYCLYYGGKQKGKMESFAGLEGKIKIR